MKIRASVGDPTAPGSTCSFGRCANRRKGRLKGVQLLGKVALKNKSKSGGVQGRKGGGGKVNLPPYRWLVHAEGRRILVPFSQLRFSILAGARRGATGLNRKVSLKVTRVVVRGRLKKRQRGSR